MEILDVFMWAAVIYATSNFLMIIRAVVVYFIQERIRYHIFKISRSIITKSDYVEPFVYSLHAIYWDFDKMMKHWWVFDINKMRN